MYLQRWTDLYATDPEVLENDLIPGEKEVSSETNIQKLVKNTTLLFQIPCVCYLKVDIGLSASSQTSQLLCTGVDHTCPLDHAVVPDHTVSERPHLPAPVLAERTGQRKE